MADPPTIDEIELPEPRIAPPASLARSARRTRSSAPATPTASRSATSWRALAPRLLASARPRRDPARRGRRRRPARLVRRRSASPRSPTAAARRSSAASSATSATTYRGAVSIDLRALDRVLEVDRASRAARIQAGVYGPALEDQLRPHGLTLRHFPQSFEFSTLGGWLATRSGGHYATLHTHIDDFVESIRAVTPRGVVGEPAPSRAPARARRPIALLLGSEGILGVITEAWMRLQDRPTFRASATARFATFERGVDAARAIAQSRPVPGELPAPRRGRGAAHRRRRRAATRCCSSRSSRPTIRSTRGSRARSSARATTAARRRRRASRCATATTEGAREGAAGAWRNAFIRGAVHARRARRRSA